MRKSLLAATLAAGLTAGGIAGALSFGPGLAGAQATTSTTTAASSTTAPQIDRSKGLSDALQTLVDNATITSAQRDAVVKQLASVTGGRGGFGGDHGGDHGPKGMNNHAEDLAKALGMTAADLRTELQGGKSLADVAKAHNIDPKIVVAALVASETAEIDADLAAGTITQAQADTRKAAVTARSQAIADGTVVPGMPGGPGGFGGGRGPGGLGGTGAPSN